MTESSKRAIRTAYQGIIAAVTIIPIVIMALPENLANSAIVVATIAWVSCVSKIVNELEDRGIVPSWLK